MRRSRSRSPRRERNRSRSRSRDRNNGRDAGGGGDRRREDRYGGQQQQHAYNNHHRDQQPSRELSTRDAPRDTRDPRRIDPYSHKNEQNNKHTTKSSTSTSTSSSSNAPSYSEFELALQLHNKVREEKEKEKEKEKEREKINAASGGTAGVTKLVNKTELQAIAQKKQEEDLARDSAMKPVFLTKAQRQEIALKKLEERRAQEQEEMKKLEQQRQEFEKQAHASSGNSTLTEREKAMRDAERRRAEREKAERDRRRRDDTKSTEAPKSSRSSDAEAQALALIKASYLGKKQQKKRFIPPSQKFKFSFDWEAGDDTSVDLNPLYDKRHSTSLLFGRGYVGGQDRREQRKKNAFYEEMIQKRAEGSDVIIPDQRDAEKVHRREERETKKAAEKQQQNRHWKEKSLEEMEERDWRIFKEDFEIASRGAKVPHPIRYWHESTLPANILETLQKVGYKDPSPIQRQAIPVGLQNRDVVGIAETGSGKTCAFLLPMLVYISKQPPITPQTSGEGPYAIIMAPTRELATQISDECEKFGAPMGIRSVSIVGGVSIEEQGFALRDGAEIIIATPGRLYDCIDKRYIVLNRCNYVVLDEADRMIDLNFEPQILKILDSMPSTNLRPENDELADDSKRYRQTIMFSATMPPKVEQISKKYLRQPVFIAIGDRKGKAAANVEQRVEWMTENAKRKRMMEIISGERQKFIIFCNQQKACDSLAKFLDTQGYPAGVLHGGKVQEQRQAELNAFKNDEYDILVATDVAARGIDVQGIQHVLNYDMPNEIQKYTHRIGRTARGGAKGIATSFLTDTDTEIMYDLKEMLKESGAPIPHQLANHEAAKNKLQPGQKPRGKPGTVFAKY